MRLLPPTLIAFLAVAATAAAAPNPPRAQPPLDPCAHAATFGCATALNLRLMLADRRDLERGAALAPAAGDAALAAAERHRLGQVKPLGAGASSAEAEPAAPKEGH